MLAVRLALAAVFLISGIAKAVSPRGTAGAARDLGVPSALTPAVAALLPAAELAVAALLALTPTVTVGGAVAAGLMACFTALVAANLIRGRRPACACFGALSAQAPIGPATLARNAILLAASLAVLVAALLPGACSAGCYDAAGGRQVAIGGALAVLVGIGIGVVLILSLSAEVGRLAGRVRDLEATLGRAPSAPRPEVDLAALRRAVTESTVTDPHGRAIPLAGALSGPAPVLLVFLSAHCSACERLRDRIRGAPPRDGLRLVGIIDRLDAGHAPVAGEPLELFVDGGRIAGAAGLQAFPSAVLLGADLRPAGDVLTGTTEIGRYLDERAGLVEASGPGRPVAAGHGVPVTAEGVPQHA